METSRATQTWDRLSPPTRRAIERILVAAALLGLALGVYQFVLHVTMDPLADARVYYEAGARLNAGLPLYPQDQLDHQGLYLNPPLLAILWRPLALFPFEAAAAIWMVVILGAIALTVRRIGLGRNVRLALCMLAMPIAWVVVIGQAEPLITLALAIGAPWSVAFAGHLKLVPWLAAIWWLGRRDGRRLAEFAGWTLALGLLQLAVEPEATMAYLRLEWLNPAFTVRNISPYAIHPALWAVMVVVLAVLALRHARSRWGWPFAVALAVLAYPRLLVYQLMSLLAAFGGPRDAGREAELRGDTVAR